MGGRNVRWVGGRGVVPEGSQQPQKPLQVPRGLHADDRPRRKLPVELLHLSRRVHNLPVFRLSCGLIHPRNLLPTGVKITSNKNHRRLLPLRELRSSTKSLLGLRTEPSRLSNQSLRDLYLRPIPLLLRDERCGLSLFPFLISIF